MNFFLDAVRWNTREFVSYFRYEGGGWFAVVVVLS